MPRRPTSMAPASLVASPPGNLAETFWQCTVELEPLQAMSGHLVHQMPFRLDRRLAVASLP